MTVYVVTSLESAWNPQYGGNWEDRDVVKGTFPTIAEASAYCIKTCMTVSEPDRHGNFTIAFQRKEFKVTKTDMGGE